MPRIAWREWFRRRRLPEVLWALDLETTGLRPATDRILAVGMVPVRHGTVRFGERFTTLVRPPTGLQLSTEGLRVHQIIPAELESAPGLDVVLPEIDARLREGGLLVHHAPLDVGFLQAAYARFDRPWPAPQVIDTIDLLLRLHQHQHRFTPHPPRPRTGLSDARAALGLPAYPGHDALTDALATAELFLVLQQRLHLC